LASAITTQAALDALAPYNALAATGNNMAFGPAFGHSKLIKLIGHIGLGVSFIGLGVSFIGGFVCCVDLSLIGLGRHIGNISLIGLGFILSAHWLIDFIGLGIEGLISKNGFIGLGLVGFIGLGLGSLINGISLIGLFSLIGFIGLVGLVSFGLNGLIGKGIIVNSLQFKIEINQSQHDLFQRESWLWCVGRVFSSLAGLDSVFGNGLQNATQLFFDRIPQMTKYCVMRECENIRSWIPLSGDLVFSHQQGIYGFKFPKRFLISLPEISLFSQS
jgi:hypothetical protein